MNSPDCAALHPGYATAIISRRAPNVLDNPGKIHPAMAGGVERLVDLLRMLAQRRRRTRGLGGVLRQRQVLHHQRRGKARLVAVVGGRGRHRARHRAIGRQRPALARRGRGDVEQRLMRQAELFGQRKGLADRDHGNAEDHVVADLGRLPGAGAAAMHDLLAHVLQHGLRRRERLVLAAAHEGQRRALGAAGAAGHRRIDRERRRAWPPAHGPAWRFRRRWSSNR